MEGYRLIELDLSNKLSEANPDTSIQFSHAPDHPAPLDRGSQPSGGGGQTFGGFDGSQIAKGLLARMRSSYERASICQNSRLPFRMIDDLCVQRLSRVLREAMQLLMASGKKDFPSNFPDYFV